MAAEWSRRWSWENRPSLVSSTIYSIILGQFSLKCHLCLLLLTKKSVRIWELCIIVLSYLCIRSILPFADWSVRYISIYTAHLNSWDDSSEIQFSVARGSSYFQLGGHTWSLQRFRHASSHNWYQIMFAFLLEAHCLEVRKLYTKLIYQNLW